MRSKHEKYTKHTNITSNSDLFAYDRLTTQKNSTYELTFAQWLKSYNPNMLGQRWKELLTTAMHDTCLCN